MLRLLAAYRMSSGMKTDEPELTTKPILSPCITSNRGGDTTVYGIDYSRRDDGIRGRM